MAGEQDARARAIAEQAISQVECLACEELAENADDEGTLDLYSLPTCPHCHAAIEETTAAILKALTLTADTARAQERERMSFLEAQVRAREVHIQQLIEERDALDLRRRQLETANNEIAESNGAEVDTARAQGEREAFKAGFLALILTRDENGEPLRPSRWTFTGRSVAHDLEPEAYDAWLRARATSGDTHDSRKAEGW